MRAESRLSWLAVAAGSSLCVAAAAVGADARWLAALGGAIVHAGRIPSSVPYAAAPSHDWVNVPVLGELVFHWLVAAGGDRALVIAQAVGVGATLALLLRDMRAGGASDSARALVLSVLPFAALPALFVVRAQLLSLPLFAFTALLLRSESRAPSRRIWLLVPLVALWSNLHGGVLIGLAVATAYVVAERVRRDRATSLVLLAAAWGAVFVTPALARTGDYYLGVFHGEAAASGYGLWAPLSLRNPLDLLFVALAAPLVWLAWRSRPRAWELLTLALLMLASVHVSRNSVWLALFVAVPAARGLRVPDVTRRQRTLLLGAWVVPLVLLVAGLVRTPPQQVAGPALRADAARLAGSRPILADGEDAEQLALDGRRVWITNPIDAFPRGDQRAYIEWLQGHPAGDALLLQHDVVLVKVGSDPQRRLARRHDFHVVARDRVAVLYRRIS